MPRQPDKPAVVVVLLEQSDYNCGLDGCPGWGLAFDAEALQDQLLDAAGVGLAAGGLHDGADDRTDRLDLAAADLVRDAGRVKELILERLGVEG